MDAKQFWVTVIVSLFVIAMMCLIPGCGAAVLPVEPPGWCANRAFKGLL